MNEIGLPMNEIEAPGLKNDRHRLAAKLNDFAYDQADLLVARPSLRKGIAFTASEIQWHQT